VELSSHAVTEKEVVQVFKEVVGRSRQEVAQTILERFHLEEASRKHIPDFQVDKPWQALVQIRLKIYESTLTDPELLQKYRCSYNLALLRKSREKGYQTGLATMSHCPQANRVLEILNLQGQFDFIATRDDVEYPKPDPEIYFLVARELGVSPDECLVIEDSLSGVKAALAADMACIAVTTSFTHKAVAESGLIENRWIVSNPRKLLEIVEQFFWEKGKNSGK
jgi:HAD superfamily hydrolase (TIGR01549 family)